MLKPEDRKLWEDVMSGVTRLTSKLVRHDAPKVRIPIRDVRVKPVLDLHGVTVHDAYKITMEFIDESHRAGFKYVTVITGLSGQIRHEFERWLWPRRHMVREIKPLNGGGAFKVSFFKNRTPKTT